MPTVCYVGKVFHFSSPIYEIDSPTIHFDTPEGGRESHQLRIANREAVLTCNTPSYESSLRPYIYLRILGFTKVVLGVTTFSTGIGATVVYEKTIEPDGSEALLVFGAPQAQQFCKSFSIPRDFSEILSLCAGNPELASAIWDLTSGVTELASFAFGGARALERVRVLISGPNVEPKVGWPLMQQALRIDAAYLRAVTDHSRAPRHGQDFIHTPDVQNLMIERCWTVIDRCIEFVRNGKRPLPSERFPLLTG